jgi:hypothetical protein
MTDPGGGFGWRSARHLPRRRGGVLGWGRVAGELELLGHDRPLCVLLLPAPLEAFELRERAEDLLTAPGVAAVDPPRVSYSGAARLGEGFADGLAAVQARRMRLPGYPLALVVFHPLQYPLARALAGIHLDAELWYGPVREPGSGREHELHELACSRAAMRFEAVPGPAYEANLPLWARMEALGIESGRLGSQHGDVS